MPSTTSSVVSMPLASSTVITPSLPTFSMACARIWPTVSSPLAETVPTWAISSGLRVFFDCLPSSSTTAATALSIPRFRSMGFMLAATILAPSRKMACASTVAVVVPSPATSEVLLATSLTIFAPRFSNLSPSSISLATVTPSFVTVGEPQLFSRTTLRPLGPSVARTALVRASTPRSRRSWASRSKRISLAAIVGLLLQHREDILLADDQVLLALHPDLGARVLAEENAVTLAHVQGTQLAVIAELALADGDDPALLRLLLGRVGDDDTSLRLLLLLDALHEQAIVERSD